MRQMLVIGLILCLSVTWSFHAAAQDSTAISQGFTTNEKDLVGGTLVSLKDDNQGTVELANNKRASELTGVIAEKPLIELNSSGKTVQVVTSGLTKALVSDINGEVHAGDKVTASPINGVGMKATGNGQIIGIAQEDSTKNILSEQEVTERNGKMQKVKVSLMPVQVNISYYAPEDERKTVVPAFLQQLANSVAGKEVSLARLAASTILLLLGFISIGVLLYASIRSSIISIGRNPLSERAVRKSLFQVGLTAFGILLVMVIAIYLILTV